jgi:hypothetical protein
MPHYIDEVNTRAVELMHAGRNEEAATELTFALHYLNSSPSSDTILASGGESGCKGMPTTAALSLLPPTPTETTPSISTKELAPLNSPRPLTTISTATGDSSLDENADTNAQPCHVLYDCAFLVRATDELLVTEYRTHGSAVLLYNTAMAYQRWGIQSGKASPLFNAVKLYGMIFTVTGPHAICLYPCLTILLLALCNNLTQLHLELMQQGHMRAARDILRDFLAQTPKERLSLSDFTFFNLSLYCLEREDFRYPPAA